MLSPCGVKNSVFPSLYLCFCQPNWFLFCLTDFHVHVLLDACLSLIRFRWTGFSSNCFCSQVMDLWWFIKIWLHCLFASDYKPCCHQIGYSMFTLYKTKRMWYSQYWYPCVLSLSVPINYAGVHACTCVHVCVLFPSLSQRLKP